MKSGELALWVRGQLEELADAERARAMAAYLRSSMPFYGVSRPAEHEIVREAKRRFVPDSQAEYEAGVRAVWALSHREAKHVAVGYARQARFLTMASVGLYEDLIREGAWWDLVDEVAPYLAGGVLARERAPMSTVLDRWVEDGDFWVQRAALLAQLRHKGETDEERLFGYCRRLAGEREFFVRKAIGWALREYSKTAPEAVARFVEEERGRLSGLSYREARKHLERVAGRT